MDSRKELILNTIIKEHIRTGAPVGSGVLVENYKLDISPATVRNEMASLEEEGYIIQPHTSAGRIPTEAAYRLHLDNLKQKDVDKKTKDDLNKTLKQKDEKGLKSVARVLTQISGNTVFWAFHRHNLYYTGISNLFQQPEFREIDLIYNMSGVIDRLDEIVDGIFENIPDGVETRIGTDNPFGDFCGSIIAKYTLNNKTGIFGILGPMRMNYERNLALVRYVYGEING